MNDYKVGNYYRCKENDKIYSIAKISDEYITFKTLVGEYFFIYNLWLGCTLFEWCDKYLEPAFDFNLFADKYDVVHCKTERDAKLWCKIMGQNGRKWCDEKSYNNSHWNTYEKNTIYYFNCGMFGDITAFDENGKPTVEWFDDYEAITIIEFEDIKNNTYKRKEKANMIIEKTFTKSDLRDWDIAVRRNKGEFKPTLVSITLGGIYSPNGNSFDTLDNYNDDLSAMGSRDLDIMEVWRPTDIEQLFHLCGETMLTDNCKPMYKRIEATTKVYSNGKTAEENHRILWNLLADHPDWEKSDALEEMEMDDTDNIREDCFACDAVKNNGECKNCPISKHHDYGCLNGLYEEWSKSTGYERATYAKEIAELEWED